MEKIYIRDKFLCDKEGISNTWDKVYIELVLIRQFVADNIKRLLPGFEFFKNSILRIPLLIQHIRS